MSEASVPRVRSAGPCALVLLLGIAGSAEAQRPLNLDFERSSVADSTRPWGWTAGWSVFAAGPVATFTLDPVLRHGGGKSLRIARPDSVAESAPQTFMLQVPAGFVRGKELRLSAWTRAERLRGRGFVTIEAWGDRVVAAADTGAATEGDWQERLLSIVVPNDSTIHSLVISVSLAGAGAVWFDDLTLSVAGRPTVATPDLAPRADSAALAWLHRHSTPLRAAQMSTDDADLRRVDDIVGNARMVALGETTHGTREFFQVKHRLLEYLVRRHGFRVFAIEANQLAVERINHYVQGGAGTAREVMRAMFAVWNTEEVHDLVEWIRNYNAAHPTAGIRFAGYDMQDHLLPLDTLAAFFARKAPDLLPRLAQLTAEYRAQPGWATPLVADTTRARWGHQADTLWNLVRASRPAWLASAPERQDSVAVEWAVQSANLFRQAAGANVALFSPERDSLMAANLDWMARTLTPGERVVVWAHDVHVSHGGDRASSFNAGAQMGAYLRRDFGYDYRALSLQTYDGAYTATRGFSDHTMISAEAFPGPAGSLEEALQRLERPAGSVGWLVDLGPARSEGRSGEWLMRPRPIRHVGYAAYDYGFELTAVMPLEFDGIVFIDRTTPSRPVRRSGG